MHRSTPRLSSTFFALASGAVALTLLAPAAQAQVTWPKYSIAVKLKAVPGFLGLVSQPSMAVAINSSGQAVGWTTKASGTVTRVGIDDSIWQNLGLPIGVPTTYSVPMTETYPVLWTAGTPKVQARYKGSNSSWGTAITDSGMVLVSAAPVAGRIPREYDLSRNVAAVLSNGQYTDPGVGAVSFYNVEPQVLINNAGWLAGATLATGRPFLLRNGQTQYISGPVDQPGAFLRVRDLNDSGVVLLQLTSDQANNTRCFTWSAGLLNELPPPSPGLGVDCRAINASGTVAGLLRSRDAAGATSAAVFVAKGGQFRAQAFEPYLYDPRQTNLRLNASGTVLYEKGYDTQADGSVRAGGMLFADGVATSLDALLTPALPKGQYLVVNDLNDAGQVLVQIYGAAGTPQAILSPVKK